MIEQFPYIKDSDLIKAIACDVIQDLRRERDLRYICCVELPFQVLFSSLSSPPECSLCTLPCALIVAPP